MQLSNRFAVQANPSGHNAGQKNEAQLSAKKNSEDDSSLSTLRAQDKIILAISGGPDSVFLLHQLLRPTLIKIKPFRPQQIILAHVNYHLRGKESEADQKFVEKLAKKMHLKLEILQAHPARQTKSSSAHSLKKPSNNLEEKCRDLRYEFFEKLRRREHAKYILTAHHLNDQIETFLFNLSRGANLAGFSGMAEFDAKRHLLRPLLHLSKKQILQYLQSKKIPYRLDKSNSDLKFSRNIIRRKIVSEFEKINSNFLFTVERTLRHLSENKEIIEHFCERWCQEHLNSKLIFPLEKFLQEIPALQKKLLAFIYKKIHGKSLTSAQIKEIHSTLQKNRAGLQKEFGPLTIIAIVKSPKTQKRQVVIKPKLH